MSKIVWNELANRTFETGVSKGVLYPQENGAYPKGVAWDGLTGVTESPSGAEPTKLYAANGVHAVLMSNEEYAATIEAYLYPPEFGPCNGEGEVIAGVTIGQQTRQPFGFSYVTQIGDANGNTDYGYKINIVYGAVASPSERAHATMGESPEAETMSWEVTTTPVEVPAIGDKTFKPTATFTLNSLTTDATKMKAVEDILYGTADAEPRLPLPTELFELLGVTGEEVAG